MLLFEERGKLDYPEKNLLEQRREPTTKSTLIIMALKPGFEPKPQWWEASALTTAPSLPSKELKPSLNINRIFYKSIFRSID